VFKRNVVFKIRRAGRLEMRTFIEATFAFPLHAIVTFMALRPTFLQALFLRTEDGICEAVYTIPAQLAFVLAFRFMELIVDAVVKLFAFRILTLWLFLCQVVCTFMHVFLDTVLAMCL